MRHGRLRWMVLLAIAGVVVASSPAEAVRFEVGTVAGAPGERVFFQVILRDEGDAVAGIQMDIFFDLLTPIAGKPDMTPDCVPGGVFRPIGCTPESDCTSVRHLDIDFGGFPDGSIVLECNVDIAPTAPDGTYPLDCSNEGSSDSGGMALPTTCLDGGIIVESPPPALDHYKCYQGTDLKTPKFVKVMVGTSDQTVASETVEVQKVKFVCNPVDKDGEGINNPNAHLTCYQIKGAVLGARPTVEVSSQFQSSRFQLKKPRLLCVPSTKTVIP